MSFNIETCKFLQILHDPAGHWSTISNVETEDPDIINVYDSLNSLCSSNMQQQIACLLKSLTPHIRWCTSTRWRKWLRTTVFSLCNCSLCHNKSPGSYMFDQSSLRQHLFQCLESQHFTMFSVKSERSNGLRIRSKQTITGYCTCRMPMVNGISMICGNNCKEWFHGVNIFSDPQHGNSFHTLHTLYCLNTTEILNDQCKYWIPGTYMYSNKQLNWLRRILYSTTSWTESLFPLVLLQCNNNII